LIDIGVLGPLQCLALWPRLCVRCGLHDRVQALHEYSRHGGANGPMSRHSVAAGASPRRARYSRDRVLAAAARPKRPITEQEQ
jgi:hypothetical protein